MEILIWYFFFRGSITIITFTFEGWSLIIFWVTMNPIQITELTAHSHLTALTHIPDFSNQFRTSCRISMGFLNVSSIIIIRPSMYMQMCTVFWNKILILSFNKPGVIWIIIDKPRYCYLPKGIMIVHKFLIY